MSKYNKGDKVWWTVPNSNLVILCVIEEVQREATWTETFYWLDEPVGHAVHEDELVPESHQEANTQPTELTNEDKPECNYRSLDEWREKNITFINSTQVKAGLAIPYWTYLQPKVQNKDWFLLE